MKGQGIRDDVPPRRAVRVQLHDIAASEVVPSWKRRKDVKGGVAGVFLFETFLASLLKKKVSSSVFPALPRR